MRIGIVVLPLERWSQQAQQWRRVEEYGFDHAWTYDHLLWDPLAGYPWGATVPSLVAAAGVTTRIPLGTWVASPNFRHPLPFARELVALDDISGGRAVLGVGAGGTGSDARLVGVPPLSPKDRLARFEEFLTVVDLALTGAEVRWSGRFYTVDAPAQTLPCVQRPRLPFVVAANGPRAMALAARFGTGWATSGRPRREDGDEAWWQEIAGLSARFSEVLESEGRDPGSLRRLLSLDSAPTFSLTSLEHLHEGVGRAAAVGFTDVVIHWPVPGAPVYAASEDILDRVAEALPALRALGD